MTTEQPTSPSADLTEDPRSDVSVNGDAAPPLTGSEPSTPDAQNDAAAELADAADDLDGLGAPTVDAEPVPEQSDGPGSEPSASIEPAASTADEPAAPAADDPAALTTTEAAEPTPPPDEFVPTADGVERTAPPETAQTAPEARPSAPPTVARHLAESLRAAGVKFAFTVPGESFLPLLDACSDVGIRVIATRHESGAAFMAEAYGQLTGRPAACIATRAVGAANLAIGIYTARADSTPMFALVGQVRREFRGREAFQEVDLEGSIGRLAKWASAVDDAATAAAIIAEAGRYALGGRPGPVVLSIPEDVLDEPMPASAPTPATSGPRPAVTARLDPAAVRSIVQMLARARRPVILAGAGVLRARASKDLVRLAELLHVPVVASWRRGDVVSNDHPLFLGMTGNFAPHTVRPRLEAADALLVLGCRLNENTTFGYAVPRPGLSWAHVDLEPRSEGSQAAPTLSLASDAGAFLRAAIVRLEGAVLDAENVAARDAANASDREAWEAASIVDATGWDGPGVHPGRVIAMLRQVLPDDGIVTTDAGNFGGWLARGFRFRRPGTFLGPTSGAMGYALPAAISAAIVHRDRPIVALAGDGGFAMTMAELETAVREHARLVALVFDNERYGTIRAYQDRNHEHRPIGTDLGPIDFAAIARAMGAYGERIATDDAFESALRTALAGDGPSLLHLALDRAWSSVDDHP
jgi:acetolactate synthase I/II/III large subunit